MVGMACVASQRSAQARERGLHDRPIQVIRLALRGIVLAAALFGAIAAHAQEKRVALVVGNAKYPSLPLSNPENDARLVSATLRKLGFEVLEHTNLGVREFRRVLREFARRIQDQDGVSVFYYAGHGVQIDGRNYLLPVDVNLRDEEEVKDESVDLDDLFVSRLERARTQARIIILDACRDNPFRARTRNIRVSSGLAEMAAARGTLIAFSAGPGAASEDGPPGSNSIYSRHLADEMMREGIEVEQMLKNVRVKVLRDTKERQVPWVNTSLTVNFSFNPGKLSDPEARRQRDREILEALERAQAERRGIDEERQRIEVEKRRLAEEAEGLERARREFEERAKSAPAALPPPNRVPAEDREALQRAEAERRRAEEERMRIEAEAHRLAQEAEKLERARQELERSKRTPTQPALRESTPLLETGATPPPPRVTSPSAPVARESSSQRPESNSPPRRQDGRASAGSRVAVQCSDLLARWQLGEDLLAEEESFIMTQCR
jgi:uncharacterized caspase-like protein